MSRTLRDYTETPELTTARARLASHVGCPAQAWIPELRRTCGGHVHAGYFCFYVRGPRAYRLDEVEDVVLHECEGCAGDHVETTEGVVP